MFFPLSPMKNVIPAFAGKGRDDGSERVISGFKCGCLKGMNFNGSPV